MRIVIAVVVRAFAAYLLTSCSAARAIDCKDGGDTQLAMNICAGQKFAASNAEMNRKVEAITGCLKPSPALGKSLLDAQRAWIAFRDAECRFQGSASTGGSLQPMVVGLCLAAVTDRRNKELDDYLTCQEGDASCPTSRCRFRDRMSKGP